MSRYEFLNLIVALLGILIAAVSLVRTRRLNEKQERLQDKQEQLTDVQLRLLRRVDEEQNRPSSPPADVRVTLEGPARDARFVIANWGDGPARNVNFTITPREGRSSPLVRGDYNEKLPIPELLPGDRLSLLAALTMTSGTTFDATLTWTSGDGTPQQRNVQVSRS